MSRDRERRTGCEASASWGVLEVQVPDTLEDEVVALLAAGSLGIQSIPAGPGEVRLRVFLASPAEAERRLDAARSVLDQLGVVAEGSRPRCGELQDGNWAERYQEGLRPFALGACFLVSPGGKPPPATDRTPILLVPGRAFGTGEHPTTRLCVAAMERWVRPGSRWLDLGTGTGILAIVAARCGASTVDARDLDEDAVAVAREVTRANGETERVSLRAGTLEEGDAAAFDGVVANISGAFFLDQAEQVAAAPVPGGVLIASGFLAEESKEIVRALERAGLEKVEEDRDEGWAMVCARRRGSG